MVPREDVARSTFDAANFIRTQRITFFSTVPSFLALMEAELPHLRVLVLGGEACPPDLVNRWGGPGLRMLNTYGPTEATVVATAAECVPGTAVMIGRALPGYVTYVLDERLTPVKAGEIGELYIGGASVARGYMNLPDLTAERFVPDPFGGRGAESGASLSDLRPCPPSSRWAAGVYRACRQPSEDPRVSHRAIGNRGGPDGAPVDQVGGGKCR